MKDQHIQDLLNAYAQADKARRESPDQNDQAKQESINSQIVQAGFWVVRGHDAQLGMRFYLHPANQMDVLTTWDTAIYRTE